MLSISAISALYVSNVFFKLFKHSLIDCFLIKESVIILATILDNIFNYLDKFPVNSV